METTFDKHLHHVRYNVLTFTRKDNYKKNQGDNRQV